MEQLTAPVFLSTLSLRRATKSWLSFRAVLLISIHALLAESDVAALPAISGPRRFLSTLSLRRATLAALERDLLNLVFLSTLSLRRATAGLQVTIFSAEISIHALLAESDYWVLAGFSSYPDFYPRSPCGERLHPFVVGRVVALFLSTLSLRRATVSTKGSYRNGKFLSTLSLRRATVVAVFCHDLALISIHALLAESDTPPHNPGKTPTNFYPRSPCGERHRGNCGLSGGNAFLSTLSLRRATPLHYAADCASGFLSTLSLRRATPCVMMLCRNYSISIHALLAESDH